MLTSKSRGAEVKIIDFGLAKLLDAENTTASFLGTRGYLAPEMLQRQAYTMSVDMWALGVIVYVLLCGCLPFNDDGSRIPNMTVARVRFRLCFLSRSVSECLTLCFRQNSGCAFRDGRMDYPRAPRICCATCSVKSMFSFCVTLHRF